jgi:uncharacterized phiE125 gp8 family phage protein
MSLLFSVVTPAAVPAVSLDDCKLDLRVDNTFEDDLILSYIDAASRLCSEISGRKLINETIKYSIKSTDCGGSIILPFTPVSSIVEIQYYDSDNVSQTMNINDFYLYNFDQETTIVPKKDVTWPSRYNRRDAINITFVTGYGAASSDIPSTITKAIRLLVAHWYEVRTASTVGIEVKDIPFGVQMLLGVDRTGWVA